MTRRQLTLAVPALLTLHNLEEALTFQHWLPVIQTRVPFGLQPWFDEISPGTLEIALVVATAVPWAVALWSARRPSSALASWFVLLVQAVVLLNVFWHLLVAGVLLRGYSPGVLTAVTLNLPFSIYLFTRARRERWCSHRAAIALVPAALLAHGSFLVGLMYFMYVDAQSDGGGIGPGARTLARVAGSRATARHSPSPTDVTRAATKERADERRSASVNQRAAPRS